MTVRLTRTFLQSPQPNDLNFNIEGLFNSQFAAQMKKASYNGGSQLNEMTVWHTRTFLQSWQSDDLNFNIEGLFLADSPPFSSSLNGPNESQLYDLSHTY